MSAGGQTNANTPEASGNAKGVAVALVRQNQDDSGMGRVRVSYPWHSEPLESYCARVAVPMAGSGRGTYFIPEVGDEVLVAFDRGDVRFPYVVGSLWNGVDSAPESNNDGQNDKRMIRSRKGHHLMFDDGPRGRVELRLDDGKRITIDDDGIVVDDDAGNRISVNRSGGEITVEAATKVRLSAPEVAIEATGRVSISAGSTLELVGAMVTIN